MISCTTFRNLTALVLALSLSAASAFAATYYVNTVGGNDGNLGGAGDPFATIGKAMTVVGNDDTVKLAGGPYVENVVVPAISGLTIEGDGARVTIEPLANAHVILVTEGATKLTLRNLEVKAKAGLGTGNALVWFKATAAVHNTMGDLVMENCVFDGLEAASGNGTDTGCKGIIGENTGSHDGGTGNVFTLPGPGVNAGFGPFKDTLTVRNCVFKNIWSSNVLDTNNGGLGDSRVANPLTTVYFDDNYLTSNKGAIGIRCKSASNTTIYMRRNRADSYDNGASQGAGGVLKLFWPGKVYVQGNEIREVQVLQGAQFDEQGAQGAAILIRDRRYYDTTSGANPKPWNVEGYGPTEVLIEGNIIADVVQAVYFDSVPYGNASTAHTWNAALPSGEITNNIFENAVYDIQSKAASELAPASPQLTISENTFGGDAGPQISLRDGFVTNGQTIVVEDNYYGAGGHGDAQFTDPTGSAINDNGGALTTPALVDSDGDGLLDWEEVETYGTNPNKADTDDDGVNDGVEILYGTNPLVANVWTDADGDGQPVPFDTNDANPDRDGDRFKDGYEVAVGTNPDSAASKPTLGDVNENGRIDNIDAVIIFQASLGALDFNSFSSKITRMNVDLDVNGNLTIADAIEAFDFYLGVLQLLPR